ncbi:MAG: hypothetical protein ACFCUT_00420 [Kiloniellaceae bacterium]
MSQNENPRSEQSAAARHSSQKAPHEELDSYGGGHIKARHGRVNAWLLAVYLVLLVWSLYYGYRYWGGLGPGLDY